MAITGTLSGSFSQFKNAQQGPWRMPNGYLYGVLSGVIFKSTNDGASWTSFSLGAQGPLTGGSSVAVPAGNVLHIASTNESIISYHQFNTATDQLVAGGSLGNITSVDVGVSGFVHLAISANPNGNVVILYNAPTDRVMGTNYRRVSMATYIGTMWTPSVAVDGGGSFQYDVRSAVLGASGRTHLFYTRQDGALATVLMHRVNAPGTNVLTTEQTLIQTRFGGYTVGRAGSDGASVIVPYANNIATSHVSRAHGSSVNSPTWTYGNASDAGNNPNHANTNFATIFHDGTNFRAVWVHSLQQEIMADQSANGTTWGTDETILTAPGPITGFSANWIDIGEGGIGVLYDDNGTMRYHGPDASPPPDPGSLPYVKLGGQVVQAAGKKAMIDGVLVDVEIG